jgi:hypothetical protein
MATERWKKLIVTLFALIVELARLSRPARASINSTMLAEHLFPLVPRTPSSAVSCGLVFGMHIYEVR